MATLCVNLSKVIPGPGWPGKPASILIWPGAPIGPFTLTSCPRFGPIATLMAPSPEHQWTETISNLICTESPVCMLYIEVPSTKMVSCILLWRAVNREDCAVTFYLDRENPQVSELLLVVLGQQTETLSSIPRNVEGNPHTVPRLHMLWLKPLRA